MNFDFREAYKDYTTIDLLKIVKRPGDYQPSAVVIAAQLLKEREVSIQEEQAVDQYFQAIDFSIKTQQEKIDLLKNKASDFFQPVLKPSTKVEPSKWLNIFLLVISLQYAWVLFTTIKRLINFLQCYTCNVDITLFAETLTLFYIPLIFFFLYRKHRLGWILLFADNLFSLLLRISQVHFFFKYQSLYNGDVTSFFLPILIKVAFAVFLWQEGIANHFRITLPVKKKTTALTTIGAIFFILIIYLAF